MLQSLTSPKGECASWSTNDERRASRRFSAAWRVRCVSLSDPNAPCWDAQLRDLSSLGVGLILPKAIDIASLLEVELTRNGTLVRRVLARVVHVVEDTSQTWHVGCALISELSNEELQVFQAEAVRPATPDFRRWARFPCNVETVCYTSETAPGERRSARVLNISAGGIGLLLRCDFPAGTLLFFEFPDEAHRPILVRVVRTIEHTGGNWILGCEFADQLDEDELRTLLR